MSANLRYPIICDQVMQYLQKCVSLLGVDSTRYLCDIGLGYI